MLELQKLHEKTYNLITLVLYQRVTKNSAAADKVANYCLIQLLHKKKLLDKVICLRHTLGDDFEGLKIVSIGRSPIFFLANKLFRLAKRIIGNFGGRYYLEMIFDRLAWYHINKKKTKLIYATKPAIPYTFKKCHAHQIKTILRTPIAHPLYNYFLVRNEEQKFGLKNQGSYSSIKRANKITKCLHSAHRILVNNVTSEPEFLLKTYLPYFEPDAIIPYRQVYVKPATRTDSIVALEKNIPRFVQVAHLNLIKGTPYLLEAWKLFQESYPNRAELLLVGALDKNLRKALSIKGLDKLANVKMVGFQKNPFAKYQNASAFILSSLSEGGPATLLEALGAGVPVITSKNSGLSNVVEDGINGFTYEFNDIKRLSELFLWFVENQERLPKMRENAIHSAETFGCDHYQDEIWPIIKDLL